MFGLSLRRLLDLLILENNRTLRLTEYRRTGFTTPEVPIGFNPLLKFDSLSEQLTGTHRSMIWVGFFLSNSRLPKLNRVDGIFAPQIVDC
jgi:hypothetical protein